MCSPVVCSFVISKKIFSMHPFLTSQRGSAFLLTLFYSALFILMFGATLQFVLVQHKAVQHDLWNTQAIYLADAGVQYYRWHLAHNPTEFADDTGAHQLNDPQGGPFGSYDITVTPPSTGTTTTVITAEGSPTASSSSTKRVRTRYGKPSLAHYAFLTNSNVWFGDTESISGELHSNGGVRMDGTGDSLLTSAQEEYTCGAEHSCNNELKPGVWGTGEDPDFWTFPVTAVDFDSIVLDLDKIQEDAQTPEGLYLPDSGSQGYFIEFHANGTLTVNTVTSLYSPVYGYNGSAWTYESHSKKNWSPLPGYQNIALPDNGLIFVEDDLWVGGQLNGRVTVVAARLPDGSYPYADIYIQDDITYVSRDGSHVLGLIAQEDVLIPLRSDFDLTIDAAVMAVHGHAYRYYYPNWSTSPYNTYAIRGTIETYGSIITNTVWTWSWVSSANGPVTSGYANTQTTYDPNLTYGPPPSFPTEDEYVFISWEQLTQTEP